MHSSVSPTPPAETSQHTLFLFRYSKQTFCNNSKFSVPEKHRILSTAQLQSNTSVKWHHKHSWTPPVWLSSTLCFPPPPHSSKWAGSTSWITAGITPGLSFALTLEARATLNPLSWLIFDNVLTIKDDCPLGFYTSIKIIIRIRFWIENGIRLP